MIDTGKVLIEIGTEELPSKDIKNLSENFKNNIEKILSSENLSFSEIKSFGTPKRISLIIENLLLKQPDKKIVRKGPSLAAAIDKDNNFTPAAKGFAKSCNIENLEELRNLTIETPKGTWLQFEETKIGQQTKEIIVNFTEKALKELPINKKMRWTNDKSLSFLRPVHWVSIIIDNQSVTGKLFNKDISSISYGHPVHSPKEFELNINTYEKDLENRYVIADIEKRKEKISKKIELLCEKNKFTPMLDESLLDEINGLVEWPVILLASFKEDFLKIPKEALIASMKEHQRCIPLEKDGKLTNKFIIVSNIESKNPDVVIKGNEKVMTARLADALFLYEKDKSLSFDKLNERLDTIIFQNKLGSILEKTKRLQKISEELSRQLNTNSENSKKAAEICKVDLLTNMVYEFPELQGIIGKHYALERGYNEEISLAIEEHYYPRFSNDIVPSNITGTILSIADKLDTLVGIIGINKKPTGDKDPYSLRRQALGIIRIFIENKLNISLKSLINFSINTYTESQIDKALVEKELYNFIKERLRNHYKSIKSNVIDAVLTKDIENIYDINLRISALNEFQNDKSFLDLADANKRVKNILTKNKITGELYVNQTLFELDEEKTLFSEIEKTNTIALKHSEKQEYLAALNTMSSLKNSISAFFDKVMVMVDNIEVRNNRLALLQKLRNSFLEIADLSKI